MILGQEFKRRAKASGDLPARIRVVGVVGTDWSVTNAQRFDAVFTLSAAELADSYVAPAEVPAPVDEVALRAPSREELRAAMQGYRAGPQPNDAPAEDAPESPEGYFARIASEQAAAAAEE